jgi:hypothetical protein
MVMGDLIPYQDSFRGGPAIDVNLFGEFQPCIVPTATPGLKPVYNRAQVIAQRLAQIWDSA